MLDELFEKLSEKGLVDLHINESVNDDGEIITAIRIGVKGGKILNSIVYGDNLEEEIEKLSDKIDNEDTLEEDNNDVINKVGKIFKATLEEIGFDKAVSLLEKLKNL